jgi:ankyrin repeat protein
MKKFPLADYAARHFADHAEFGKAISHITDGIDDLLNADKPHFAVWMSHISSSWWAEKNSGGLRGSPLYHVADLGFYGQVQHLTSRRPQDVLAKGGVHGTPVHAALHRRHGRVCQLLLPHCVGKDVRDSGGQTPLHVAASNALLEDTRVIIELGADINARITTGIQLWDSLDCIKINGKDFFR